MGSGADPQLPPSRVPHVPVTLWGVGRPPMGVPASRGGCIGGQRVPGQPDLRLGDVPRVWLCPKNQLVARAALGDIRRQLQQGFGLTWGELW